MQHEPEGQFILQKLKNELPGHLHYHTIEHTLDVYSRAEAIARQENVPDNDRRLLLVAALYHDAGYLYQREDHESLSCDIAGKVLPQFGYSSDTIETICGIIMATQLPQNPQTHLQEIICDADLDYLGRDDFFETGHRLYLEMLTDGIVKNEEDWNRLQLEFLEKHRFFTKTTLLLRQLKKEDNLKIIRSKIS